MLDTGHTLHKNSEVVITIIPILRSETVAEEKQLEQGQITGKCLRSEPQAA